MGHFVGFLNQEVEVGEKDESGKRRGMGFGVVKVGWGNGVFFFETIIDHKKYNHLQNWLA